MDAFAYRWCDGHELRAAIVRRAALSRSPLVRLPDGRTVPPGLPAYHAVARAWGERSGWLVLGALTTVPMCAPNKELC